MSTHDELKANAAGYALGTLDTEELRAYPAAYAFSSSTFEASTISVM